MLEPKILETMKSSIPIYHHYLELAQASQGHVLESADELPATVAGDAVAAS